MRRLIALALALGLAAALPVSAEERMNGMIGAYYSDRYTFGFEYDLIAQFQKSNNWFGNITGPFIMDEATYRENKLGAGFVVGKRVEGKGTYAASVAAFMQNRWSDFGAKDYGYEGRVTLMIFGVKIGFLNQERLYYEVGISY